MDRRMIGGWVRVTSGARWFTVTFLLVGLMFLSTVSNVHAATIIGTDATVGTAKCPISGACGSTLSWTHTVGSNSNRILIVGISAVPVSGDVSVTLVQFGSSSLTPLTPKIITGRFLVQQWYLLNPSGSATVTATFANSPAFAVGASASFFNVAGVGASNGATGTGTTASVTVSAISGDLVVDTLATSVPLSVASDASQTQLWNLNIEEVTGAGSDKPASSPVTMQWTFGGTTVLWALVAVDLQPAGIPPIPEYALGLPLLAIFMVIGYGLVRRRTRNDYT
ncbi:MAG: hypothetical protein ABSD99_09265 [Candidatus Bathyarchaeia archaeon]|jgi:hypothetical protein